MSHFSFPNIFVWLIIRVNRDQHENYSDIKKTFVLDIRVE